MTKEDTKEPDAPRVLTADERDKAVEDSEKAASKVEYKPVTAQDDAPVGSSTAAQDKRALDAGVIDASFIDYEKAMANYESRSDVEPLAERRAREAGVAFSDTNFRREIGETDGSGVVVSTDPGAVSKDDVKSAKADKDDK